MWFCTLNITILFYRSPGQQATPQLLTADDVKVLILSLCNPTFLMCLSVLITTSIESESFALTCEHLSPKIVHFLKSVEHSPFHPFSKCLVHKGCPYYNIATFELLPALGQIIQYAEPEFVGHTCAGGD